MCGIWALVGAGAGARPVHHAPFIEAISPRGPDRSTEVYGPHFHIAFHRLAIHDLSPSGDQPFRIASRSKGLIYVICNGEIYNAEEIQATYGFPLTGGSDCEVLAMMIVDLWDTPREIFSLIRGEYAFVAIRVPDEGPVEWLAARDPFGVRPLYWGNTPYGPVFSSTLAGVAGLYGAVGDQFPPGHMARGGGAGAGEGLPAPVGVFDPPLQGPGPGPGAAAAARAIIAETLVDAVRVRMSSERPLGFLLSGGLDSSLLVAIAVKALGHRAPPTFSIGLEGSPDLAAARKVARHLGTQHTEVIFTIDEAIAAVPEVIRALETYDITTIRASIGSFLLARYIRINTGIRALINGDGSDEVAGGYLYHYYAPSAEDSHYDCLRLLHEIHRYDGLRVDRTLGWHGLEARLPFLDPAYVRAYLAAPAGLRAPRAGGDAQMEKQLLRDAFDEAYPGLLPREILYRRKEAFSDGVSGKNNLIAALGEWAMREHGVPERAAYAKVFDALFPGHRHVLPGGYWMPKWTQETDDPSARTLAVYGGGGAGGGADAGGGLRA